MIGWLVINFHFWNLPIKIKSYLGMRLDWTPFWVQQTSVKLNQTMVGMLLVIIKANPSHFYFTLFSYFLLCIKSLPFNIEWLLLKVLKKKLFYINVLNIWRLGINIQKNYLVVCIIATRLRQYHTIIGKVGL